MSVRKVLFSVAVVGLLAVSGLALAQFGGQMPPGGGGFGRGGGREPGQMHQPPDPKQMRQMMMERVKEALESSDEEWKVLEPRVERVMTLSREAEVARAGVFGRGPAGRGGSPPMGGEPRDAASSAVAKAAQELRQTLDDPKATAEQVKAKLAAFRSARDKARGNLASAQEDLRQVVTQRQEAQLVLMGLLD